MTAMLRINLRFLKLMQKGDQCTNILFANHQALNIGEGITQRNISFLSENILKTSDWFDRNVVFSWHGEDYRPIRKCLSIKEGSTIFSIASCGYNPSTLLLDNPAKLVLCDIDETQVAWCMLYYSAINRLNYEEFKGLIGFAEGAMMTQQERGRIYDDLRTTLPSKAREYWDKGKERMTKAGMYMFGNNIPKWGAHRFIPIAHSEETIKTFLSQSDIEEQRVFYEQQWNTWRWRRAFIVGHQNLSPSIYYPYWDFLEKLSHAWLKNFDRIAWNIPAGDNPQFEMHITGYLSGKYAMPAFWTPENFAIIKDRLDRIELVHSDGMDYFKNTKEKFDGIVLSNCGDAFNQEKHDEWVARAIHCGKKGSRITYLTVAETKKEWPTLLLGKINIEKEVQQEAHRIDRGFLWNPLAVATII